MNQIFFSYNLRENDLSVMEVAWHRAAAVTVGVLWAALLSRFWWPAQARKELSKALGELSSFVVLSSCYIHLSWIRFCLELGWLYSRFVFVVYVLSLPFRLICYKACRVLFVRSGDFKYR